MNDASATSENVDLAGVTPSTHSSISAHAQGGAPAGVQDGVANAQGSGVTHEGSATARPALAPLDPDAEARIHQKLVALLDRQVRVETLDALVSSLKPTATDVPLTRTAIGLDANVFLRIGNHAKRSDIVDYLHAEHAAPLILPGQSVQEFWNNQLQAVDTVTTALKRKFEDVRKEFAKVDQHFGPYASKIDELLGQFSAEHGYMYDEATVRKTVSLLEMLQRSAIVPYAPRLMFSEIATQRKKTKTPPGFKDEGDGDFFVWTDFLKGLLQARESGQGFDRVVLLSYDQKIDWSRAGLPHPILVAEVHALLNVPFEIWTLEKLATQIAAAT